MRFQQDRRRSRRELCSDLVELRWTGVRSKLRACHAVLEDLNAGGMGVSLDRPLPVHAVIHIHGRGFDGKGRVRYCEFAGAGFVAGLEFLGRLTWDRKRWRPRHLLETSSPKA